MPFLDAFQIGELLDQAKDQVWAFTWHCDCWIARDYCRSCDEFYWVHSPECPRYEQKHHGHRLTIVPFVELREPLALPTHCYDCGVILMGGATEHREGCEIRRLIEEACK